MLEQNVRYAYAINLGHSKVEDDYVRTEAHCAFDAFLAAEGSFDGKTIAFKEG
jgi:hypothetical protein